MNLQGAAAMARHSCCVHRGVAAIASASSQQIVISVVNRDLQLMPFFFPRQGSLLAVPILTDFSGEIPYFCLFLGSKMKSIVSFLMIAVCNRKETFR